MIAFSLRTLIYSALVATLIPLPAALSQDSLLFAGPVALSRPANEVGKPFAREKECQLRFETQSGNSGALFQLSKGSATIALLTRPVRVSEQAEYSGQKFISRRMGVEVVIPLVERSVWEAGVRALTKAQLLSIYDRDARNWKALSGPDVPISFINLEQDNSAREALLLYFYQESVRVPVRPFKVAIDGTDSGLLEEFGKGYVTYTGFRSEFPEHVRPLNIILEDGTIARPVLEDIVSGRWPIQRPLHAVAVDPVTGNVRSFLERLAGPEGAAAFKKFQLLHESVLSPSTSEVSDRTSVAPSGASR
jgi:phosphate transport system substrate-binding protein